MEHFDLADSRHARNDAPEPWREPVRGGHPDARLVQRAGADQLRATLDGTTPAPPLSRLTGMQLVEFAAGAATFRTPLSDWLAGADGTIPLGSLTIPADAAMACAILAILPEGTGLTTSELALRQVRPVRPGGSLVARARMLDAGPPVALAEVTLTDGDGTPIAYGSSLCLTLPALATSREPAAAPDAADAGAGRTDSPDPWERPLTPAADDAAAVDPEPSALTRLADEIGGRRAAPRWGGSPACAAFPRPAGGRSSRCPRPGGCARRRPAGSRAARWRHWPTPRSAPPSGTRPAAAFMPIELGLNYLRPLASDGRDAVARAELVHAGRRIGMARAEVTDADGRLIAVAGGSAISTGDRQ